MVGPVISDGDGRMRRGTGERNDEKGMVISKGDR